MNAIRLTTSCTDTRRAYAALLNAQIATQVCGQTGTRAKAAEALANYRNTAARMTAELRKTPLSRTANRPTVTATAF